VLIGTVDESDLQNYTYVWTICKWGCPEESIIRLKWDCKESNPCTCSRNG